MAHVEQRQFFEKVRAEYPDLFSGVSVLEIGSLNINGTIRDLFDAKRYIGVDVHKGDGVDVVAEGQHLKYRAKSFDVAVSAECFEHNPYWRETFVNMHRMARKAVLFTCASTGRPEHGTTRTTPQDSPFTLDWDYYRNLTAEDFADLPLDTMFKKYTFTYNPQSHDLYFCGIM